MSLKEHRIDSIQHLHRVALSLLPHSSKTRHCRLLLAVAYLGPTAAATAAAAAGNTSC
jgi:hypothetical protein